MIKNIRFKLFVPQFDVRIGKVGSFILLQFDVRIGRFFYFTSV